MPGYRLQPEETPVPRFAIAGMYGRPHQDQFVCHLALVRDDCHLAFDQTTDVWHCAPPIIAGERTRTGSNQQFDSCAVHAISHVNELTTDEIAGIETTLAEIDAQTQPVASQNAGLHAHYVVHPTVEWVTDPETGTRRFRKFSCVGFILECYDVGADIRLLDLEATRFAVVDSETLAGAYGRSIHSERVRERYGVSGPEPWQIALPGYVMHSLSRPSETVRSSPHAPSDVSEAEFPRATQPVVSDS